MASLTGLKVHHAARVAALVLWLSVPLSSPAGQNSDYPSAEVCATCHKATYDSWTRTFHALSAIDPVFIDALKRTDELGSQGRGLCLMCHSPTTSASGDFDLSDPLSKEGVTCSFCHSVTAVDYEARRDRFTNEPSRVKTSGAGHSPEHRFESRGIMMNAEFCAGCHEWVNAHGLRVLSTYSEWKESFFAAEQIACQQCHMPESPSMSSLEGSKTIRPTNLHFQMGGHSQHQLVTAAELDVTPQVSEKEIRLEIAVTNAKAGHKLPTGIPNRKMKLLVELYDRRGRLLDSRKEVFSRVIADAQGLILDDVTDQFVRGARELSDNRIAPKETRRLTFVFDRPAAESFLLAEASLQYDILTPYLTPPVLNFDIITKRVPLTLAVATKASSPALTLALIAAVFLFVTAAMIFILFGKGAGKGAAERKE